MVDTCYFDGTCGLCQRSRRVLEALDWLGSLRFVDQSAVSPERLPVSVAIANSGMPMTTGDGRVYVGFPAVRRALMRTPLGMIVAWPLYLPGLSQIGTRAYGMIAANRHGVCKVSA